MFHAGIASTIDITGKFAADVKVDFQVTHFQSLEGDHLSQYTFVTIAAFVMSFVVLVEKVLTVRQLDWRKSRKVRNGFLVDLAIQVFLPVLYFAIRYDQIVRSKEQILDTIGIQGLAGVPWASREVPLLGKVESFLESINKLQALNFMESVMRSFYFVLSTAQLLRLIMQTSAHPRTAILVNTRKLLVLSSCIGNMRHAACCALLHCQIACTQLRLSNMRAQTADGRCLRS